MILLRTLFYLFLLICAPLLAFEGKLSVGHTFITQSCGEMKDSTISLDVTFEKPNKDSRLFLHLETGKGNGLDEVLNPLSCINADAADSGGRWDLTEGFYEICKGDTSLALGILDPTVYVDQNRFANDETTQFLAGIFRNNPCIDFPDNALGAYIRFPLTPFQIEGQVLKPSFHSLQLTIPSPNGNIRFFRWVNSGNRGRGLSLDHELGDIGFFARYGLASGSLDLRKSYSFGLQLSGKIWQRENDYFGIAVGWNVPYQGIGKECQWEFYYNFFVNENLAISPHLQVVSNAKRDKIFGLRMQTNL